jgi:hypothetical protein
MDDIHKLYTSLGLYLFICWMRGYSVWTGLFVVDDIDDLVRIFILMTVDRWSLCSG